MDNDGFSRDERERTRTRSPADETPGGDAGARIDDYRIVRKIGEGGMGVVFEAEQQHPLRPVAIKVIRGGPYADESRIKLFRREAQALARLKHPGIAAIYASGRTEDGQHFLAMELVRGEPLAKLIHDAGEPVLPSRDERAKRLRLFLKISHAVNYAHQRGVIHRDLKPSNIIVVGQPAAPHDRATGETVPDIKILDFGLARIADTDSHASTVVTELGRVHGTLSYMSPEQARGHPDEVDTRSDVYALGVVLYELMTGVLPYDVSAHQPLEAVRIICESPPRPPHRLFGQRRPGRFDRDLETIILKTLEKEPVRRYQSVLALADDVERYLNDEPILARPPSIGYVLRKLVSRHKGPFALAVALLVLICGSTVMMTIERNRARTAAQLARTEAAKAKAINDFLQKTLASADPSQQGREVKVVDVLDRAGVLVEREFGAEPAIEAAVHGTLGETYAGLGEYDKALTHAERALAIRTRALGPDHPETLEAMNSLAGALYYAGRSAEAEALARETLTLRRRVLGEDHEATLTSLVDLGAFLNVQGKFAEAEEIYRKLLQSVPREIGETHRLTLTALNNLGYSLKQQGKLVEAETSYRRSLRVRTSVLGEDHPDTLATMANLGALLDSEEKHAEAEAVLRRTLELRERVLGSDHPDTVTSANLLGINLCAQNRDDEAIGMFRRVLSADETALPPGHWRARLHQGVYGACLRQLGRYEEAEALLLESYAGLRNGLGGDHSQTGRALDRLVRLYEDWGKPRRAEEYRKLRDSR